MPELPEVETTVRALALQLPGRRISAAIVRNGALRWPISPELHTLAVGAQVLAVTRRGKYLLLRLDTGYLLLHLGMSGSLRVLPADTPVRTHDHVDLVLDDGRCLRLHDPRRFGALLWAGADPAQHPLLAQLGPEPLALAVDELAAHLHDRARGRRVAVRTLLMDSRVVVGVGNIYASEALFEAAVRPARAAGRVSRPGYGRIAAAIQTVLHRALAAGGTTLRDYVRSDGQPGYFALQLAVYGRTGEACHRCGGTVRLLRQGLRSAFYCPGCQH